MSNKTFSVTSKLNKFFIGDICYILRKDVYDEVWGDQHNYQDGCFEVDSVYSKTGEPAKFAVADTMYGDGDYDSTSGASYPVDAGVLGIVPAELFEADSSDDCNLGTFHEGSEMEMEVTDNGTFIFYLDGKEIECVYTGTIEEEDEYEIDDDIEDISFE